MTKRTKYTVTGLPGGHVAKFSDHRQAMRFAWDQSRSAFRLLIEVSAPLGLIGQYRAGQPTPEFKFHHDSEFTKFRGAA